MNKFAVTEYEIHPFIKKRWSPVGFSEGAITPDQLGSLMEAARWAPSCYNDQPWSFIYGFKGTKPHQDLVNCLVPANAAWASKAPLLLLSIASTKFKHNGKDNDYALHDVGLAVGQMLIQATSMGLMTHQMAGYDKDKARSLFNIPDNYEPVAMIAMGGPAEPGSLPEDLQKREDNARSRKPLQEMVFEGTWGNKSL